MDHFLKPGQYLRHDIITVRIYKVENRERLLKLKDAGSQRG